MRLLTCNVLAILFSLSLVHGSFGQDGQKVEPTNPASCGTFGTSVEFVATPSDAAKQALKEEKLVFVLHVSGDFEDPDFT